MLQWAAVRDVFSCAFVLTQVYRKLTLDTKWLKVSLLPMQLLSKPGELSQAGIVKLASTPPVALVP